jgi:hypothetical protein
MIFLSKLGAVAILDHVTSFLPLTEPLDLQRGLFIERPPSWPRRFLHHVSFGPPSIVPVLVPMRFPQAPSLSGDDLPPSPTKDLPYTIGEQDKDMTRGMGQILREPRFYSVPATTRANSGSTSSTPSPLKACYVDQDVSVSPRIPLPLPTPSTRVLRDRQPAATEVVDKPVSSQIISKRRPVNIRWFYEPVEDLNDTSVLLA